MDSRVCGDTYYFTKNFNELFMSFFSPKTEGLEGLGDACINLEENRALN